MPRSRRGHNRRLLLAAAVAAVAIAATATGAVLASGSSNASRAPGYVPLPPHLSARFAGQMSLSPMDQAAPSFSLTDQRGHTVSLVALRGKVVVLEFMDPHCTDICPLVAAEFARANRDLGPAASKVEFVSINVNQYYATVADVAAFSREQQLYATPDWHFVTGPIKQLQASWKAYGIAVDAPNPNADIIHTSRLYFIDPHGVERFVAVPTEDKTTAGTAYLPLSQLQEWGHAIAVISRDLSG
jgi:cytochrome oxidase Cu insertion factor (SCO1/SenC/PrrC family)